MTVSTSDFSSSLTPERLREDKADIKQLWVWRQNKAFYSEGLISLYLLKKKVYFLKEAMICCKVNSSVTYRNS